MINKEQIISQTEHYYEKGLKGVVFLRHAHRADVPSGLVGNDIPISAEGYQASIEWGKIMRVLPFEKIESSPVFRCLQTAHCIQQGFQKEVLLESSILLGNPGVFIDDPKEAERLFLNSPVTDILKRLVNGYPLRGLSELSEGVARFFHGLFFTEERLRLFISHDSIIAPICCYLFDSVDVDYYTPDFLETVLIFYDEDHLHCCFRNEEKVIKRDSLNETS